MFNIMVLGGGAAGLLAGIILKEKVPNSNISLVYSESVDHIRVGEGTFGSTPSILHNDIGIPFTDFNNHVKPIPKLGLHLKWGPRNNGFYYPFQRTYDNIFIGDLPKPFAYYVTDDLNLDYASSFSSRMADRVYKSGLGGYHLENHLFISFLLDYAAKIGVQLIKDHYQYATLGPSGISSLHFESGKVCTADLFVDASGFSRLLIGQALGVKTRSFSDQLLCDSAVIGSWNRGQSEPIQPYTVAETMDAGWAWQIDHENSINRGYVFSSEFISEDAAKAELLAKNPKIGSMRTIRFSSQASENAWVQNVVAIGNANGFVEPLEATNLQVICQHMLNLSRVICNNGLSNAAAKQNYNHSVWSSWLEIKNFLALHYKFNTRNNSEFWRAAREETPLHELQDFVDYYRATGPNSLYGGEHVNSYKMFDIDGLLTMMVGMCVSYENKYASINRREMSLVNLHLAANQRRIYK